MPQQPNDKIQPKKSEQPRVDRETEDIERDRMADEGGVDPEAPTGAAPDRDEGDKRDEDEDEEQERITQRNPSVRDPDDRVSKH